MNIIQQIITTILSYFTYCFKFKKNISLKIFYITLLFLIIIEIAIYLLIDLIKIYYYLYYWSYMLNDILQYISYSLLLPLPSLFARRLYSVKKSRKWVALFILSTICLLFCINLNLLQFNHIAFIIPTILFTLTTCYLLVMILLYSFKFKK